jgi:hypothetical protein
MTDHRQYARATVRNRDFILDDFAGCELGDVLTLPIARTMDGDLTRQYHSTLTLGEQH